VPFWEQVLPRPQKEKLKTKNSKNNWLWRFSVAGSEENRGKNRPVGRRKRRRRRRSDVQEAEEEENEGGWEP